MKLNLTLDLNLNDESVNDLIEALAILVSGRVSNLSISEFEPADVDNANTEEETLEFLEEEFAVR